MGSEVARTPRVSPSGDHDRRLIFVFGVRAILGPGKIVSFSPAFEPVEGDRSRSRFGAHARSGRRGLSAGMTTSYHYDVEAFAHRANLGLSFC